MGKPAYGFTEADCAVVAGRLNVLLDSNGWDDEDIARKVGVTIPRARFLLQGEIPEPAEFNRIVALLERNGA